MDNYSSGNRRRQTRSRVFRCLYEAAGPLAKQDLASRLSLSLPTVYQNINELLKMELIEYTGPQASSGGRPAMQMRVVAGARFAVGIFITVHKLHFTLTNLMCESLAYKEVLHSHRLLSDEYNAFLSAQLEYFIDENRVERDKLLGVGICLSGIVSDETDTVFYAPTLGLKDVSLKPLMDAIPYPVHIDNDANCGGFAEWFIESGSKNIAFLSLSDGVGGALFINGDKYYGSNQRSGEFGHMCVEPGGLPCACGKSGCLEAYCSISRLTAEPGLSLEEFFRRHDSGEEKLVRIWDEYLRYLAIGIRNVRMALDCWVVLGGMMSEFIAPYLPRLRELVAQQDPFCDNADYLSLGHYSGKGALMGAALYFVREFLENSI